MKFNSMTSFADITGFSTSTEIDGDFFNKYYSNINDEHWLRIKSASLLLSNENIGPKVLSIIEDGHIIQYEKITPFNNDIPPMIPGMSVGDIQNNIILLVNKLHSLGYGHGDLHIENIGFKENNIYMLDHDTIYKIGDGQVPWLLKWMQIGFEWNESFEAFVDNDYNTWDSDWLSN
jgi:hypothetical protein